MASGSSKEQHYFDRFHQQPLGHEDVRAYHRLFPRPAGNLAGEWTPRYMHDFWTPARLAQAAPETKVLVLLRDPWDRFLSGLRHETHALRRKLRRDRLGYLNATIVADALSRSLYLRQLLRVFEHFDRTQMLLLQYERCCQDPAGELRRTYEFLEIDPEPIAASVTSRVRPSPRQARDDDDLWPTARATIARDVAELSQLVPEIDLELWPSAEATYRPVPS